MEYADAFHDLAGPETSDRFLPWKSEAATTPDGRLIGLGTDIGPEAICFRSDLFEAAGLPSDREEVAELLGGENSTWDKYFEVGKEFVAKSDAAWFDAATQQFQIMAQQLANPYETDDNQVIATTNPEIKAIYDQVLQASVTDDLSAHIMQWNDDWTAGFQAGDWATMACPSWMLGTIEGNAAGVTGWDVANVFPNGGGNLGGSYVAVPTQTAHPEEAIEFATWLTAPEQQVALFFTDRTWPSATQSQSDPRLLEYTSEFFNDAPVGEIMSARALAINGLAHMGPLFSAINELAITAIARVDVDKTDDPASSWAKFETEVAALAGS
jgi:cellobiose transport system substrate-binding protein